jgi:hypothetical protein
MPQIVVTAGTGPERRGGREVMRERVTPSDLESELFVSHLVERIEWALADADTIECRERGEAGAAGARASGGRLG